MNRTIFYLVCFSIIASHAWAGCRNNPYADYCGLAFKVKTEKSVYSPREQIDFIIELVNTSQKAVYIPSSLLKNGPIPCVELASGEVIDFNASFPAPECDKMPSEGDFVLEAGKSIKFTMGRPAYPEIGQQIWTFESVLYECPEIFNSVNCEIESYNLELIVREETISVGQPASVHPIKTSDKNISLSTVDWDYEPWLENFKKSLLSHWEPPYSYYALGMVSGQTVMKIVVELSGEFRSIEILEKSGHKSLHRASVQALEDMSGTAELPVNFPENELVVTITMVYPALR